MAKNGHLFIFTLKPSPKIVFLAPNPDSKDRESLIRKMKTQICHEYFTTDRRASLEQKYNGRPITRFHSY